MTNIQQDNYRRIMSLLSQVPGADPRPDALKFKADGFMDLNLDFLSMNDRGAHIALSHYGRQNGDAMADPDMEISLHHDDHRAVAMTYQNDYAHVFRERRRPDAQYDAEFDGFLNQWLRNIAAQGHILKINEAAEDWTAEDAYRGDFNDKSSSHHW